MSLLTGADTRVDLDRGRRTVEITVAVVALFLLGMRQFIHSGLTSGYLVALLLMPVWIPRLRRYRGGTLLWVGALVTVVWGWVLSKFSYDSGHHLITANRTNSISLLVGVIAGVGVVVWARHLMSESSVGLAYGLGMLVGEVFGPDRHSADPWKFAWAVPVGVVLLSLAARRATSRVPEVLALGFLVLASAAFDSRSYAATFALAAILAIWQARRTPASRRASWGMTLGFFGALAVGIYYLGSTLLVNGYLGEAAQVRSVQQIDASGSLILGGRPELAATIALMRHHPSGFGPGIEASYDEILVAKNGMAGINYDPNNGYVEKFMFGNGIELHSTFGDMWATWGLAGLAMVVLFAALVLRGLAQRISERQASALLTFLGIWTLWNVFFSPLYSAAPTLVPALGLVLLPAAARVKGLRRSAE